MVIARKVVIDGREFAIPSEGLIDRLTRVDELLIANLALSKEMLDLYRGSRPVVPLNPVEMRRRVESGEYSPYEIKTFALDAARTDELVAVEGDFISAWTDGALEGVGVRYNHPTNSLLYFARHNPVFGFRFWKLYLTSTAQGGKTLDLMIGREAAAYAENQSVTAIFENKVSAVLSSTTTPLAIAATYTGAMFSTETYARIIGSCYSDVAGTLYVEQTNDGVPNYDVQSVFAYAAGALMGFAVEVVAPNARIRFTNGGVIQTAFRLYARARRV